MFWGGVSLVCLVGFGIDVGIWFEFCSVSIGNGDWEE